MNGRNLGSVVEQKHSGVQIYSSLEMVSQVDRNAFETRAWNTEVGTLVDVVQDIGVGVLCSVLVTLVIRYYKAGKDAEKDL